MTHETHASVGPLGKPVFFWSGIGLMAAGGGVYFGLTNPTWSEIDAARTDPTTIRRADADSLTTKYNAFRYTTLGLLGLGLVSVGGSFVADLPIQVGPSGLVLNGAF